MFIVEGENLIFNKTPEKRSFDAERCLMET
jgi:hypothetical protein